MRVIGLSEARPRPRRVALGQFDGVHLGHREVIADNGTVLTFEPHPALVVKRTGAPKLITSFARKLELIASLGVEELVVVPFDTGFAALTPPEFIEAVLVGGLGASSVSVGVNFRFGHGALGDVRALAADERFQTRVVELVQVDGAPVSSSRIRALVANGEVAGAARLLGYNFVLEGTVVAGDQRGRKLGFPTANIAPDPRLACPGHGVYACRVGERMAAVNVGVRPTFGSGLASLVEVFVLDFDGDLYGQRLRVEFVARLRDERRFTDADALVAQMHRDVEATRELLGSLHT
jgi:riboflavin kinase/FMN adenylyltransferase